MEKKKRDLESSTYLRGRRNRNRVKSIAHWEWKKRKGEKEGVAVVNTTLFYM